MLTLSNKSDFIIYEKYLEVLDEKRSNPELNIKVSTLEELSQIDKKYNSKNDVFVTFTEINKFGNNPRFPFDTPLGIYAYQLKYVLEKKIINLPFQAKTPFLQVFKAKKFINIKNLPKYRDKIYAATDEVLGLQPGSTEERETKYKMYLKYRRVWFTMYNTIIKNKENKQAITARKILLKAGITGLVDDGDEEIGTIHPNEPTQAVFLEFRNLTLLKTLLNDNSEKNKYYDDPLNMRRV